MRSAAVSMRASCATRAAAGHAVFRPHPLARDAERGAAAREEIGERIVGADREIVLDHQRRRIAALGACHRASGCESASQAWAASASASIGRQMRVRGAAPVVARCDREAARNEDIAPRRVQSGHHRVRDRRRIVGIAPDDVAVAEIFGERRDARGHHRHAARHRLQHDEAEAFLDRGKHQRIRGAVERRASAPGAADRCESRLRCGRPLAASAAANSAW